MLYILTRWIALMGPIVKIMFLNTNWNIKKIKIKMKERIWINFQRVCWVCVVYFIQHYYNNNHNEGKKKEIFKRKIWKLEMFEYFCTLLLYVHSDINKHYRKTFKHTHTHTRFFYLFITNYNGWVLLLSFMKIVK